MVTEDIFIDYRIVSIPPKAIHVSSSKEEAQRAKMHLEERSCGKRP
jgi:hypothetical protein